MQGSMYSSPCITRGASFDVNMRALLEGGVFAEFVPSLDAVPFGARLLTGAIWRGRSVRFDGATSRRAFI
jgi:hypothetical protein